MRTIVADDKVLFCGSDVARALGYANSRKALADHTKAGVTIRYTDDKGVNQARKYIPEGDVYRLIVSSKLPALAHLRFWEKRRCESAIPVIFPPIGQKSYVYKV